MSSQNHFDELVPRFLELKKNISDRCDGNPDFLYEDAKKDEPLRKWCFELNRIADELKAEEQSAELGKIAPVNPEFRKQWDEYIEIWAWPVSSVSDYDENPDLADSCREIFSGLELEQIGEETEDDICRREKHQIVSCIKELKKVQNAFEDHGGNETSEWCFLDDHIKSFEALRHIFSLDSAVERFRLIPPAFVSRKVDNKITPNDKLSLYRYWNEARKAFILGTSMASIAMARTTLEVFLRDVFKIENKGLKSKIEQIEQLGICPTETMHKIREVGDAILHGMRDRLSIPGKIASENPTREALQILKDLKQLIEAD